MDRFVSHFTNRFDAKGRISIPAPFRNVLAKDGFEGLYVHPSLDAPALDCGGNALLREIDALLETMPAYSEQRDVFSTALLGTSEILKLDSEGRVILSELSRDFMGLTTEAVFVGQGHKFQNLGAEPFRDPSRGGQVSGAAIAETTRGQNAADAAAPHGARE